MNFNGLLIGSGDPGALAAFYTKLLGEPMYTDESVFDLDDRSGIDLDRPA